MITCSFVSFAISEKCLQISLRVLSCAMSIAVDPAKDLFIISSDVAAIDSKLILTGVAELNSGQ